MFFRQPQGCKQVLDYVEPQTDIDARCCRAARTALLNQAQTPATPAAKPASPPPIAYDKWEEAVKKPTDWLTWGGNLRVRDEYMPNTVTISDASPVSQQNVIRFRGRNLGIGDAGDQSES